MICFKVIGAYLRAAIIHTQQTRDIDLMLDQSTCQKHNGITHFSQLSRRDKKLFFTDDTQNIKPTVMPC